MIQSRIKTAIRAAQYSIVGNLFLAGIKIVVGVLGHSFAMIADGIESVSDILSSILVWVGLRYAARPPDRNHPYGHGKAEPLVTFAVVGLLIASSIFIIIQSIYYIRHPHSDPEPYVLIILGLIILIKEGFYQWMRRKGEQTKSRMLEADAWHHRSDAITSLAAFIGISVAVVMGEGYEAADDWAALVAAGIILYNAYRIFRPALSEVMDENTHHDLIESIRILAIEVDGILDTEKCYIRKNGMLYHVDLHAIVNGRITVYEGHELAHRLKDHLKDSLPEIADVHIHVEPASK
ncbi:cation diffusion facilitator family transporter [Membranicola marinus]|uniref:Cation diffusion facilitator family transporter n=1 Tax=Membranihabitans marinus TaxID=1227546 RepID=A0A953HIX3_9BACT|nr:cation diffusion facilitator family transporter [Membranihabitans marinus]MBY5956542.1 cation diffusion facilitator family transporter [Membranihabitans marinus]